MPNEFSAVWLNENRSEFEINAANLNFMLPSISVIGKRFLSPHATDRTKLTVAGECSLKLIVSGVHHNFKNKAQLDIIPVTLLDTGTTLQPGKDYYVYLVKGVTDATASIVVSLNATFPAGSTAANSRKIGGFHTLCADVGTNIPGHALSGMTAGQILPQSVWDLKFRPECSPEGMVFDPNTQVWVDIYIASGSGENTKSAFGGTVTKSQAYDYHSEDLLAVGKRMLWDGEFTSAAMGTVPGRTVMGAADPITTGGKLNTSSQRIISDIGCEDMCGCYWLWIYPSTAGSGSAWADAGGQGQQYQPIYAMIAGSNWGNAAQAGPRARYGSNTRSSVGASYASRGAARAIILP